MTRGEIKLMVIDVIQDQLGMFEDVTEDMHLENDLMADSLDRVEIAMDLEERLDIEISDEDGERCSTVKHVIDLVDTILHHEDEFIETEVIDEPDTKMIAEDASN